ncbi:MULTISPECIES: histidine phosphatase family protein [Actinomyces]|uniref:Histidine phosphatase family protein n=1 Tax=Actinomyces respiraculi TaxID=2744574 RepID=A0A7T0LMI1_9ACTO|nr:MULTISPECIES: histidine phosphatase family protein [Actinomyces]QPL06377.1 histidine phosphatase family protein [Actinomyces respiraculi]
MKLILVRHGRTIANVMGALDTAFPGNDLDAVGRAQAEALPERLTTGLLGTVGSLWVSPIERARQTIAPIERATGREAHVRSGLREVLAGDLEMHTDRESVLCYTDTTRAWMVGRLHARLPGSPENGQDTFERFDAVVREAAQAAGQVAGQEEQRPDALLVAHGTILRLWAALAAAPGAGVDPAWIADHPMANAGISVVEGDPGRGWVLRSWADGTWSA